MSNYRTDWQALLAETGPWVVLTGAGISADSGIPTYRDAKGAWLGSQPIQHQEFLSNPRLRRRYWYRSMNGWPDVRDSAPNANHYSIADFEALGKIELLITQNVDRLHQRAGSQNALDLHGRLDRVKCLGCGEFYNREWLQQFLTQLNPKHIHGGTLTRRPDGDVDLESHAEADMQLMDCEQCGGILMPDVVFFGGSVPKADVARCDHAIEHAAGLITLGSSLQVYSGFRLCKKTVALDKPLLVFNEGVTRADDIATHKIESNALAQFRSAVAALETKLTRSSPSPNATIQTFPEELARP